MLVIMLNTLPWGFTIKPIVNAPFPANSFFGHVSPELPAKRTQNFAHLRTTQEVTE